MHERIVPKLTTHLFFSDVCSGHGDDSSPCALNEAIGGLAARIGGDDAAFLFKDPVKGLSADEFLVEVGVESTRDATGVGAELLGGRDNVRRGE